MARKPNYSFEKHRKEQEKRKRKEEKRQRKRERKAGLEPDEDASQDDGETPEQPA